MRPFRVVVLTPKLDDFLRTVQTDEDVVIQAFVTELAVKALNVCVLSRFARLNKSKLYVVFKSPQIKCLADKLRSKVMRNLFENFFKKGGQESGRSDKKISDNEFQLCLDYPFESKPRYKQDSPNKYLYDIINRRRDSYKIILEDLVNYNQWFSGISVNGDANKIEPAWENGWLPILDGMSLYYFLAKFNPANYVEVGSGNSTKFARQAIKDHNLRTVITSIDPQPRAEIDRICDVVVREHMENVVLSVFDVLGPDDILFIDNSHRMFINSDATVTFLDVLPRLKKGVLVEIHDICLPYDYPAEWVERYYSEQYGLACYLLAEGQRIEIVLPNKFIIYDQELSNLLNTVWNTDKLRQVQKNGCSFWIRIAS